jgi:hypothetical protein
MNALSLLAYLAPGDDKASVGFVPELGYPPVADPGYGHRELTDSRPSSRSGGGRLKEAMQARALARRGWDVSRTQASPWSGRASELGRTLPATVVFGRESVFALADSFLEAAGERFSVPGFEGDAGIGNPTAWRAVARRPGSVDSACSSAGPRRRSRSLRCAPSATCSSPSRAKPLPHRRSRGGGRLTSRCCGSSRAAGWSRFRSASTPSWLPGVDRSS